MFGGQCEDPYDCSAVNMEMNGRWDTGLKGRDQGHMMEGLRGHEGIGDFTVRKEITERF